MLCKYVQQPVVVKEEVPSEQQEWSSTLDREDPEPPPHIKEEQEELWSSQEGEQLQGLKEADITTSTFTPVPVKSEDDEEKSQSSQLHQRQTEHLETEADGEDCGGPEPARNSDPERHLQLETEDNPGDSSEPDTEDSADWKEPREPVSASKSAKNKQDPVSDSRPSAREKRFRCSQCGKENCSKIHLIRPMNTHTRGKPFSCSVCNNSFTQKSSLQTHMKIHTGERPFSCSVCNNSFTQKGGLKRHMIIHTGEKPFSCSVCEKSLTHRGDLNRHMRIHTGEKPFHCGVCDKRFIRGNRVKSHRCGGRQFSQLHQTEESREAEPPASSSAEHMETEADGEDCGGPEPARNSDPERHLQPETEDNDTDDIFCSFSDVKQLVVVKEEVPPEQQEWSSSLDQEDPEPPPHIKEEQEEHWSSQLQGLEEADITKSTFTPVPVKTEDDEEKPQCSQLHQRQTEHLEKKKDLRYLSVRQRGCSSLSLKELHNADRDLKWEQNIGSLTKKAQQMMFFLRQLKKFNLPKMMMVNFYTSIIEFIFTSSITIWYAAATAKDKGRLQCVIRSAEKVIGCNLSPLHDLHASRTLRRAGKIVATLPTLDTNCSPPYPLAGGCAPSGPKPLATLTVSSAPPPPLKQGPAPPLTLTSATT
nr:zinc finger and BTB domain-containing protein 24-like [Pseudochaenichthys georgianus]